MEDLFPALSPKALNPREAPFLEGSGRLRKYVHNGRRWSRCMAQEAPKFQVRTQGLGGE